MTNYIENVKNSDLENDIIIVSATKNSTTELLTKKPLGLFLEKSGFDKKSLIQEFNKEGLSKVYNKFLTEEYRGKYIIFVHDDVLIDDLFFIEKVTNAFKKYDIIGLAGSKTTNLDVPRCAWHLMTERENMVGEVAHSHQGNLWTTVFGPTDSRALVLDGLFLGVNVSKLLDSGLFFDENFDFHHYDLSFCLRANEKKIKVGVFPLRVIHFGLGDSMNTKEWENSNNIFKKLYNK